MFISIVLIIRTNLEDRFLQDELEGYRDYAKRVTLSLVARNMVIFKIWSKTLMRQSADPTNDLIYSERISSNKTEALFLILMILFFLLYIWRVNSVSLDWIALLFACFVVIFLFYSVNFRILLIGLTPESLKLSFGIFTWMVPVDNIQACSLDELPVIMKYGGAGIHFMTIRKRYRASFNFLEYSRVVIAFKEKVGPVRDISFSTCRPEEVIRLVQRMRDAFSLNQGEDRTDLMAGIWSRPVGVSDPGAPNYWEYFGARLVELADLQLGERVLDVGCGSGSSLFPAAAKVGVHGFAIGGDICPG